MACAQHGLSVGEFTPRQIKLAVVGEGTAEKEQVQYMVRQIPRARGPPSSRPCGRRACGGHLLRHARSCQGGKAVIAFLKGTMAGSTLSHAFINVNGVGFSVGMSATDLSRLPGIRGHGVHAPFRARRCYGVVRVLVARSACAFSAPDRRIRRWSEGGACCTFYV